MYHSKITLALEKTGNNSKALSLAKYSQSLLIPDAALTMSCSPGTC